MRTQIGCDTSPRTGSVKVVTLSDMKYTIVNKRKCQGFKHVLKILNYILMMINVEKTCK